MVSIQTQCLFDAKSEGVPHLIYTDHTHLANLGYPAFDRRDLAPRAWLARERAAFARADAVLVMSDHVRQSLLAQYRVSETRAHRVGVGMNTPDGPPPQRTEGRDPTALFVGVEWARKGGPNWWPQSARCDSDSLTCGWWWWDANRRAFRTIAR